jgi:hypothetical protein
LPYIGPRHHTLCAVRRQTASSVTCYGFRCVFFSGRSVQKLKTKFGKVQVHVHTNKMWRSQLFL